MINASDEKFDQAKNCAIRNDQDDLHNCYNFCLKASEKVGKLEDFYSHNFLSHPLPYKI